MFIRMGAGVAGNLCEGVCQGDEARAVQVVWRFEVNLWISGHLNGDSDCLERARRATCPAVAVGGL